jgi:hypothetical protein
MKFVVFAVAAVLGLGTLTGCTGPGNGDTADSVTAE